MGICDSKSSKEKQSQNVPTTKSANTPQLNSNYDPKETYNGNNGLNSKYPTKNSYSSSSYGLALQTTRAQSIYDKNAISENEFKKKWSNIITI